ncbi:RagB/SusD family nutrient uptake outer membrane protein [Terrimonas sp. NA20]|uniref:RagB/SusD family nutrient uptake outer membrane protein n=1 Tax=Terrimonas ginsenosidimutans TaxID=2908004 RepID=A0ABS9KLD0_9BACT|nr:RagB/SusD family nutrient uptake outer membrane protein [Terrimonas ginsenosidimutans]MCG2613128.1 RagB/SusD family nutrient uptake outer membrane protein [Terrimonas ginsenosidimutans]
MKFTYLVLLLAVAASSCKKYLDIPFPQGQVSTGVIFTDDSTAEASINGLYAQMMVSPPIFLNGALTIYPGLSADELFNTSANTTSDQFYKNALLPNESAQVYNGLWKWGYTNVFHSNAILEGLENAKGISVGVKTRLRGEALSIRALFYFYLTNLYGDIPLELSTSFEKNSIHPRTDSREIYRQIIEDLREAVTILPETYPRSNRTRINRFAAASILARVYLYNKDYRLAEETSTSVIDQQALYSLENDLSKTFLLPSRETIFQLYPTAISQNSGDGFMLIPLATASARPSFALSPALIAAFESGDKRRIEWIRSKAIGPDVFYYPFKYRVKSGTAITEANVVMRLAEQLLIRAEARLNQNNISGALNDLNLIRKRAGLVEIGISDRDELLRAVIQERRVELMVEKGHRWFDLKRLGLADVVLAPMKPGWSPSDALYPIPQADIDRNPFLHQNPGY